MIRDRGRIKWTAMMLPEHVEQLREWQKEDGLQIRQQPDEQQLEQWNYQIHEAAERKLQLSVQYWNDAKVAEGKGYIKKIDALEGTLHLVSEKGETHRIPFVHLKSISETE
ncbi:YolD-like family protein [Sporosarcina sp. ACRSL]|uniref:YolD-like family protein n=1 Tax=Sporosarcina sp. ACRSL TaxID=2918215 RepID=UPI001EF5C49E|nr:YolD-like family protein [Sporosarcina sp. ACRSL]MCG7343089.1 YolD-like family protein [Sporosarcina sp. ACRSL]